MSTKLDLLSLSEEALARLYAERIEPILRTQESERGKAMIVFRGRAVLVVLGAMAAAALAWWLFQDIFYVLFAGVGIGSIGLVYAYQPLQEVANATKQQSLTTIAEASGCDYRLAGFQTAGVRQLEELKLLPSCDRASYQDCFSGKHAGCAFSFHDGHRVRRVKTKNGERWDTVFRGQLIRVAFPKQFLGTTVIRRDAGLFNFMQRWFTELQRVGLVVPDNTRRTTWRFRVTTLRLCDCLPACAGRVRPGSPDRQGNAGGHARLDDRLRRYRSPNRPA